MSGLVRVSRLATAFYGAPEFWRDFGDTLRAIREDGRTFLEFDEWRAVLRLAHKAGLLSLVTDGKGEPQAQFASPFGPAFYRLYRALKSARERGLSAAEFQAEFDAKIDRDQADVRAAIAASEENRRQAIRAAAKAKREANTRRRRTEDDEPDFTEVRVGDRSYPVPEGAPA